MFVRYYMELPLPARQVEHVKDFLDRVGAAITSQAGADDDDRSPSIEEVGNRHAP